MIVKGGSRAAPKQLAYHLQRVDTNEQVEILELNALSDTLEGAFYDWQVMSEGTRGKKGLYHVNIDPAEQYAMTPEQWARAVEVLEEELGLQGQPRAVVRHEKYGREHIHVVWCRTDFERGILRRDNNNYLAHERASQRLELEFGHEIVPGKHAKRDRDKQPEFPRAEADHTAWQQAERTRVSVAERKQEITGIRKSCDDAHAFRAALAEAGYLMAKGDKRGIVLVDRDGEVFSLSKYLTDVKGQHYNAFMAPIDRAALPSVEEAKALHEQKAQDQKNTAEAQAIAHAPHEQGAEASRFLQPPPPAQQPQTAPAREDPEVTAIKKALADRQAKETQKWADFHAQELRQLEFDLDKRNRDKLTERDARDLEQMQALKEEIRDRHTGLKGFLNAIENRWNPQLGAEKAKERRREIAALKRRQKKEREDYAALLEQTRQLEIDNLKQSQALKRTDINRQHEEEKDRYIREHEEAKRILAETKAEEKRQELEHNDSLRDGPPPPKLGK